jgi:hypothetical protein
MAENISLLRNSDTKQILIPPVETGGYKCFAPPERGNIPFLSCSQIKSVCDDHFAQESILIRSIGA